MYGWYERRKRQVWAVGVATVAAASAAYVAYQWYTTPPDIPDAASEVGPGGQQPRASSGADASTSAPTDPGRTLEAQLQAHLESLKAIADEQTMPETRRQLRERVVEVSGAARVHASLRTLAAAPPTAQTRASKRELWADLRDRTVWLAATSVWLLPAITLLVHVQVVVLGRHMYLERMTADAGDDASPAAAVAGALGLPGAKPAADAKAPKLWPLSGAQQEAFMSYSSFLLHDGLVKLLPETMPLVQAASRAHAPQAPTSVDAVWQMLSEIHRSIDACMSPCEWAGVLLPPIHTPHAPAGALQPSAAAGEANAPSEPFALHAAAAARAAERGQELAHELRVGEVGAALRGCSFPACFEPAGLGPEDASVVAALVLEARQIVQSRAFGETLRACVKHCASHVAERIRSRIAALQGAATQGGAAAAGAGAAPDTVSLAHVVSNVLVDVPNELLAEQSSVGRELAKRQDVEALMLNAYARGPFLDDDDSD